MRWEAATSTPNVLSGSNVIFTAPLLADPGTTYTYGINTDWLGKVVEAAGGVGAGRRGQGRHHRPAGHGRDRVPAGRGAGRKREPRSTSRARTAPGTRPASSSTRSRSTRPAGTACTRRPATTSVRAGAARRRRARRRPHPAARPPWTPRSPTRSASWTSRRPSPPPTRRPPTTSTPGRAGSGATACCSTPRTSPACAGPGPGPGPGCATPTSGSTQPGIAASIYSNFLPFVPPEALQLYADFERALYAVPLNRARRADRTDLPGADIRRVTTGRRRRGDARQRQTRNGIT